MKIGDRVYEVGDSMNIGIILAMTKGNAQVQWTSSLVMWMPLHKLRHVNEPEAIGTEW